MTKFIVVVGGVISGVGKGVTTASLGKILQEYGYLVTAIKIDPYLNYDAGTLRPTEHGEVWVTDDGGEIDQDLGNYERFLDINIPKKNNLTTGQIYKTVIDKERRGEYLGKTVQPIPHITDEIKRRILSATEGFDIAIIEIGGTIGDYENIPYLFTVKSLEREFGKENVVHVLVSYMIVPRHIEEMKTKPTQQAIKMLSEAAGIFPDFIVCRGPIPLDDERRKKLEMYANIKSDYIISQPDIDTIYRIPIDLELENMGFKLLQKLNIHPKKHPSWYRFKDLVTAIRHSENKVIIGIVGKYIDTGKFTLTDSYTSVREALIHASANLDCKVELEWIDSTNLNLDKLKSCQGIVVPGGFGSSGIEGKLAAIKYTRENNIPYLGLCYGMQLALIEFARNVCNIKNANTSEIDPNSQCVIDILESQIENLKDSKLGGTMRLGAYAAILEPGSKVLDLYKQTKRLDKDQLQIKTIKEQFRVGKIDNCNNVILERHRHRYEVNPKYIDDLSGKGLIFSGYHIREDNTKLVEFIELKDHKFFIATQAHPEFKSRLTDPAPLFLGFIKACFEK